MDRRKLIAGATLTAATFAAIIGYEGYTSRAVQPVEGDQWTYGFGNTVKANGEPVRSGDTITPPAAVQLAVRDIAFKAGQLKACIPAEVRLTQYEYDALVSLAYNVGAGAVCRSSIPAKLAAGEYTAACNTILDFRRVQGRDCSAPANRHFCGGVWTRRQDEAARCRGELQ